MSFEEPNDRALVNRAAAGDTAAFGLLYERYSGFALHVAGRFAPGHDAAEDAVQDAFLYLYLSLPRLRFKQTLRSFLYPVAKHCALNVARERYRITAVMAGELPVAGPATHGDVSEADCDLPVALDHLSDRQRQILRMRFWEERSAREIAGALDIAEGTVRATLHHAVSALRHNFRFRKHFGKP